MGGDNRGKKKGCSGTTIKVTWTKPSGGWKQVREEGLAGMGGNGGV